MQIPELQWPLEQSEFWPFAYLELLRLDGLFGAIPARSMARTSLRS
jgi:hypothetical protein